jgi:hypothetical protein
MVSALKEYSAPQGLLLRTDNSGVQGQFGVSHVILVWIGQSYIVQCRALGEMQRKPTDGRERCDRNQNRRAWIEKEGERGESSLARQDQILDSTCLRGRSHQVDYRHPWSSIGQI